ncbi:MAG TPA: DUF6602 domain-containing protein [Chloroflexia bacterium]|jgi:hypothetical protein
MSTQRRTGPLLQEYFRQKKNQILAMAAQAVAEHTSLIGSHREVVVSLYLDEIVPKRFKTTKAMVYDAFGHRSKEADIVIWDASNYPSLAMQGHSLIFAESVKVILEIKSNWSADEFSDIRMKCEQIGRLIPLYGLDLSDEIASLERDVLSLLSGRQSEGTLRSRPRIGTCAIVLRGGQNFTLEHIAANEQGQIDDSWPDLLLLMEPGKVVTKRYVRTQSAEYGLLELLSLQEDALLTFTSRLLELLSERIVPVEDAFYLSRYTDLAIGDLEPVEVLEFPVTRPVPGRFIIWRGE